MDSRKRDLRRLEERLASTTRQLEVASSELERVRAELEDTASKLTSLTTAYQACVTDLETTRAQLEEARSKSAAAVKAAVRDWLDDMPALLQP